MQTQSRVGRVALALVVAGGLVATAAAGPGPALDQNKLNDIPGLGFAWHFNDGDGDLAHDAGEVLSPGPPPAPWLTDMSCWMASAANLLQYEGYGNPYVNSLTNGGAVSPSISPWGNPITSPALDGLMTFDDGGWQEWAIAFAGAPILGPITTINEFGIGANAWGMDAVGWCQNLLNQDHPVGLTVWSGRGDMRGMLPGQDMYHAITLWDIIPTSPVAGTLYITDSDDRAMGGLRPVSYMFAGLGDWTLQNLYPGVNANVNYGVAIPEPATLSLLALGALLAIKRRR